MAVTAIYELKLDVGETMALGLDNVSDLQHKHQISGGSGKLDANSTVPATKAWSDNRQLAAGSDSIDLNALPFGNLPNVDLTGVKVQLVKIKADAANTAAIKFKVGAANGYNIFGSATGEKSLPKGAQSIEFWNDQLPDVGAAAKNIDITSSDADAKYDIELVAG